VNLPLTLASNSNMTTLVNMVNKYPAGHDNIITSNKQSIQEENGPIMSLKTMISSFYENKLRLSPKNLYSRTSLQEKKHVTLKKS
jgi:hypothetical protein